MENKNITRILFLVVLCSHICLGYAQAPIKRKVNSNKVTANNSVLSTTSASYSNEVKKKSQSMILNGFHEKTYSDGRKYKGNFANNQFDGYGELTYPNGDIYKGQFKNGKKEGKGIIIYKNHFLYSKYDGSFANDEYNGWGILYWNNGYLRHEGNFVNGEPYGQGTTYYDQHPKNTSAEDLLKCEGQFNGLHMIKGTIYYYTPNSIYSKYIGECDKSTGYPKGQGTMYYKNGIIYEGHMYFHPDGYGKMTYPDGRVFVGKFERGAFVE